MSTRYNDDPTTDPLLLHFESVEETSTSSASDSGSSNQNHHTATTNDPTTTNSNNNSLMRRRLRTKVTKHRQSLLKIHDEITSRTHGRHTVPDPRAGTGNNHAESIDGQSLSEHNHGHPESSSWVEKHIVQTFQQSFRQPRSCIDWIGVFVPFCKWLKTYDSKNFLLTDILAGIAVGVMIIPQSMSYAKLAGLPVEYGLYSSLVPIFAYAMFGSSRQLAVGPVALVSLLLNTGLTEMLKREGKTPDSTPDYQDIYNTLALQTSFLCGLAFVVMGLLRLGFVTIFLSHAVVSGFTSAAAIIIGLSQVKYIFGYDIPSDKSLHRILRNIFASIEEFNYKTFLFGTFCILTLMGMKKLGQTYPKLKWTRAAGPLLVTVIGVILQAAIDLESRGIPIVGHIPQGFPSLTASVVFPLHDLGQIYIVVVSIVLIGFLESIAIAKQLANKNNYELDSSMELFGLGVANMASGMFGGYPVVGSFSRSAVNNEAGAKSGISAIVTATLVGLVLLFMTPVFELLPSAVLASIVISGVISLVDYPEAIYLWKVHKFDFAVWMLAFLGTLFLGAELGLGIAVAISLLLVIFESAYPHTSVLGRLPGTHQYVNTKQYPNVERYNGIVMVRIDAPIYFANTQNVREKIQKYYERAEEELEMRHSSAKLNLDVDHSQSSQKYLTSNATATAFGNKVRFIILELAPVSHVDTSALHILSEMVASYKKAPRNVQLCLANPNRAVMHRLVLSGLADEIGREHIFVSLHDAVEHCLLAMDQWEMSESSPGCPLVSADFLQNSAEPMSAKTNVLDFFDEPLVAATAGDGRDIEAGHLSLSTSNQDTDNEEIDNDNSNNEEDEIARS